MNSLHLLFFLLLLSSAGYFIGRKKAFSVAGGLQGLQQLHSRPVHYGALTAMWCGIPALLVYAAWLAFEPSIITGLVVSGLPDEIQALPDGRLNLMVNDIRNLVNGNIVSAASDPMVREAADRYIELQRISSISLAVASISLGLLALVVVRSRIVPTLRARNQVERIVRYLLIFCSMIAIFTTIGIVLSVLYEAIRFFQNRSGDGFSFRFEVEPPDGHPGRPGRLLRGFRCGSGVCRHADDIHAIAMAGGGAYRPDVRHLPFGIRQPAFSGDRQAADGDPGRDPDGGIRLFAALTVAPFIRDTGLPGTDDLLGKRPGRRTGDGGHDHSLRLVAFRRRHQRGAPIAARRCLRPGRHQVRNHRQVVMPAALPGIVGGLLLAVSRAIGETMIVVMAAGLAANLTANPFQAVTTVTVQIVTLLVGDQEFDSPKTLAAFALGLLLFIVTLILNVIALVVVRKYREQYE
jgi:phosphate transport system permease protein